MATTLQSLLFRGTRRIRLIFSAALATGAFTSTSYYAVQNDDGLGPSPINVVAVFAIANTPGAVELAIDEDLAPGALYTVTCTNVPCADLSTYSGSMDARTGLPLASPVNAEPTTSDVDLLLFGRDLVHDGVDFVEDATGDLDTITGRENYRGAMGRRLSGSPLPWDPTYSPDGEQYIDAPQTQAVPFRGALLAQARADDRTRQASVDIVQSSTDPGDWAFEVELVPIDNLDPVTVPVPNPTGNGQAPS